MMHNHSLSKLLFIVGTLASLVINGSCNNEQFDDQIPFVSFPDKIINLKSQQYLDLQSIGYVILDDIGVRGVILHKSTFGNDYVAFERNCSYQPNDASALIEVAASALSMQDNSCGSTFEFIEGTPTAGPARNPLRKYRTSLSGDFLTITDEPIL